MPVREGRPASKVQGKSRRDSSTSFFPGSDYVTPGRHVYKSETARSGFSRISKGSKRPHVNTETQSVGPRSLRSAAGGHSLRIPAGFDGSSMRSSSYFGSIRTGSRNWIRGAAGSIASSARMGSVGSVRNFVGGLGKDSLSSRHFSFPEGSPLRLPQLLPGDDSAAEDETPLPTIPTIVLCIVLFGEFLSASVAGPFMLFMISDLGVGDDEPDESAKQSAVGFWSGIVGSVFFLGQFLTSLLWVDISQRFGKRFVMCICLFGNSIVFALFGLSTSLTMALVTRFLQGVFNGSIGVARAAVTGITDPSNESRAITYLGLCWGLGAIFGSVLGGILEHAGDKYFDWGPLHTYPYALPCFLGALVTLVGSGLCLLLSYDGGPRTGAIRLGSDADAESSAAAMELDPAARHRRQGPNLTGDKSPTHSTPSSLKQNKLPKPQQVSRLKPDRRRLASLFEEPLRTPRDRILALPKQNDSPDQTEFSGADTTAEDADAESDVFDNGRKGTQGSSPNEQSDERGSDNEPNQDPTAMENGPNDSQQSRDTNETATPDNDNGQVQDEVPPAPSGLTERLLMASGENTINLSKLWIEAADASNPVVDLGSDAGSDPDVTVLPDNQSAAPSLRLASRVGLGETDSLPRYTPQHAIHPDNDYMSRNSAAISEWLGRTAPADMPSQSQFSIHTTAPEQPSSALSLLPWMLIAQYATLALHSAICDQVFVSFLVTPVPAGGLGLAASDYAILIALMFFFQMIWQFRFYPVVGPPNGNLTHLSMFRLGLLLYLPVYLLFPNLRALLSETSKLPVMVSMTILYAIRYLSSVCAYTAIQVLVTAMSPEDLLPLSNGVAGSIVALARFVGPVVGGVLWQISIAHGPSHPWPLNYSFGFFVNTSVCFIALVLSLGI